MDMYESLRIRNVIRRIERRRYRATLYELRLRSSPFDIPDQNFRENFRLNKTSCRNLISKLERYAHPTCIPFETQVLTALNFYARGCYQGSVGQNHLLGLSQPSVSRCIRVISNLIVDHLLDELIKFPRTLIERVEVKQRFYTKFGMPCVLGAIDGTHIAIVSPPEMSDNTRGNLFINRKGYHSLNVLVCCDSNMRITFADARFPGSTHDSAVWLVSELRKHLKRQFITVDRQEAFLIGDSGFPLEPWIMTPFNTTADGTPERLFNNKLIHARQIVERCFGLIKSRFRCLLKDRVLHYDPIMAGKIVYSVFCLHNICVNNNLYEDEGNEDENENEVENMSDHNIHQWHTLGEQVRQRYIRNLN